MYHGILEGSNAKKKRPKALTSGVVDFCQGHTTYYSNKSQENYNKHI